MAKLLALLLAVFCFAGHTLAQQPPPTTADKSQEITILKPNHTGFTVSSLTEAIEFWNGVLGLPVSSPYYSVDKPISTLVGVPGANVSIAFITLPGGHQVEILEYTGVPQTKNIYRPESCDVGSVHLALDVKGMDEIARRALKVGWRIVGGPLYIDYGKRAIYLRSIKDGITVELFETTSPK
jgi:catechol 2,3-dioxygenase-like lactoylglutathione lyase family enzyme